MDVLRSLIFYLFFYIGSIFFAVGSALAAPLGAKTMRVIPDGWAAYHHWCARALLGIKFNYVGERPKQPVLYAMKHESFLEAIELPYFLDFPAVFAKEQLFRIPFWGHGAKVYGLIPVFREQGATALRSMLKLAKQRVKEGRSLAIFPEGTRVPSGAQPPLKSGFAGIYKMVGLPVVPVAIDSGPIYHRRWKKSGTITFLIGETIPAGLPREEAEALVHKGINALNTAAEKA